VKKVNLKIPIKTLRSLVATVKALQEHYFFYQLPEDWIEIKTNKETDNRPNLPMNREEANLVIRQIPAYSHLTIPIKIYENITPMIDLLRTHFRFRSFPTNFIEVPDLL
ncbi:23865_t:CDS:1, partial [Gigaspora margarita]